jgi:hypothetical protein
MKPGHRTPSRLHYLTHGGWRKEWLIIRLRFLRLFR